MIFVTYPTLEYLALPFKLTAMIMFFILAIKIIQIRKNTLNYLFSFYFLFWVIYLFADSIIWLTAANSLGWFNLCQFLRDITVITAMLMGFLIFIAAAIVLKGEKAISKQSFYISLVIAIIILLILIPLDSIKILVDGNDFIPGNLPPLSGETEIVADFHIFAGLLSVIPIGIYSYVVVKLANLSVNSSLSPHLKSRMLKLSIGIGLIGIGFIYFIFLYAIDMNSLKFGGYLFWILSPLLIWSSQKEQLLVEKEAKKE